jgi:membrane protein implicated in regulation of membrane protease activity
MRMPDTSMSPMRLFTAIAVAALALLRGPLQARLNLSGHSKPVDSLVGERAIVTAEVLSSGAGKVEMRGSSWSARSTTGQSLRLGRRCVVDRVDGLTLWVSAEGPETA